MLDSSKLKEAGRLWRRGQTLEAGKLIFEGLPIESGPRWAAEVLRSVLRHTGIKSEEIERLLVIVDRQENWTKAHVAFTELRRKTLQVERTAADRPDHKLLLSHLLLAELVAKVTYNATNPPDEFDEDSGWWIAPLMKEIQDLLNDERFSATVWPVLSGEAVSANPDR